MGKAGAAFGGGIGSLFGLIVGMIIPSEGEIAASFLTRMTGNIILQDPTGFLIATVYTLIAISFCGVIGGIIGSLFDF